MFLLKRKSDGLFLQKTRAWGGTHSRWTDDPNKSRIFTSSGHPKLSMARYVPYRECPSAEGRAEIRRKEFDALYEVVPVTVKL